MTQQEIQAYNQKLVNENDVITIIEYVKKLNDTFYHIDISFIDDFIELVDKEGFIISHDMLFKYQILSKTSSTNVLISLNSYELEDHLHYQLSQQQVDDGRTNKNIYMLTSDAFKIISMRSKNSRKYAEYYLLLEKSLYYYSQYEKLKLKNKIDKLENTLENRVIVPSCKSKIENLVIVYLEEEPEFQYYVIRGQIKHIKARLRRLNKTEDDIIAAIDTPNSVDLWINIREELYEHLKLDKLVANNKIMNTGYFQLQGISEKEIIRRINQTNSKKYRY